MAVHCTSKTGGVVLTGILGNDTGRSLTNGARIYTNTIVSVGIHGDSPVAVTKSGTIYRLLDPAALPNVSELLLTEDEANAKTAP